jgi:UDP-N-acetylmuramyl-tripeptide synthetase
MLELHQPLPAADWLRSRVTASLCTDSRKVRPGDGFIAWPGAATDGRHHVAAALQNGARACLVEHAGADAFGFDSDAIATYPQLKAATGPIAAAYFGQPTRQLDVIAITGTNGKTSTAWWLAHSLLKLERTMGVPCGLVGTLGIGWPRHDTAGNQFSFDVVANGLTTPDPVLLQQNFRSMADAGVRACAVEASSIGIEESRLDGTCIRTAVFTNFTHDHLDYHGSMQAYWQAKASLFAWPGLKSAVVNIDDPKGVDLVASLRAGTDARPEARPNAGRDSNPLDLWTVSCTGPARLRACDITYGAAGLRFNVVEGDDEHALATQLIGQYNVSNLLCVIGAMRSLGVPLAACVAACHALLPVPGRMEFQGVQGQPLAAVDYAHTPDALGHALQALRPLVAQRGGQLWCVFGCGGDRDPIKRPLMGAMAASHADRVIVTNDNPRSEQPQAIISQILLGLAGFEAVVVQADRALAIAQALAQADARDVVLVAGKGHEDYQEVAGVKQPFSDRVQVAEALQCWVPPAIRFAAKSPSSASISSQPGAGK